MGVSGSKPHEVPSKWFPEYEASLPSLEGKTVAVTGCTSGTGYILARTCVRKHADTLFLLNRPSARADQAEAELLAEKEAVGSPTKIETVPCDLQNFSSVDAAISAVTNKTKVLDVLCNNAGVMALEDVATVDGYDVQMQTNHLSHFRLTKGLYPLLLKAAASKNGASRSRVVQHSSLARFGGTKLSAEYFEKNGGNLGGNGNSMIFMGARWERYHQTKLANAIYTLALSDKFDQANDSSSSSSSAAGKVIAAVAAPGLAATNLQVTTNQNGGMGSGMWIMRMAQSAEDGTMPLLAACFDPTTENGDFWEPAKMGRFKGPPVKVGFASTPSTDQASKDMLWTKSEEACGKFSI